jgi:hypothetical protein
MRSAHCEIRPGENVTLLYLSHDGSPGLPPCEPPPPCGPMASASQSPLARIGADQGPDLAGHDVQREAARAGASRRRRETGLRPQRGHEAIGLASGRDPAECWQDALSGLLTTRIRHLLLPTAERGDHHQS